MPPTWSPVRFLYIRSYLPGSSTWRFISQDKLDYNADQTAPISQRLKTTEGYFLFVLPAYHMSAGTSYLSGTQGLMEALLS